MLSLGIEVPTAASFIGDLFHDIKAAFDSGDMNKARDVQVDSTFTKCQMAIKLTS